jgi:DNA (cytosine-5)-methyltransferase 1
VRPRHVIIENVPTAIHGREGAVRRTIRALRLLGYNVDSGVIGLSSLGIPQSRKRHVVIASLSKKISIARLLASYQTPGARNVRWAIGDLVNIRPKTHFDTSSQRSPENIRRINYLFKHHRYDLPDSQRPKCHRSGHHSYKSMYGRLHWDQPAQTITSGFGSPGQGRFVHPSRRRTLTPHEAARLQFFPDSFRFPEGIKRTKLAEMIGNAVPMKLAYVFALELLD